MNAINIYKDNIVLGIGPKMFRIYCDYPEYRSDVQHPQYIFAIIGRNRFNRFSFLISIFLLIINILLSSLLYLFFKKIYFSDYQIFLLIAVFISYVIFTNIKFWQFNSIIYYLPVGFLLNSFIKKKYLIEIMKLSS